jgi:hypothetical protein
VSRRLRLTLFLVALAATGPMPLARFAEAARAEISIAWFRSDRAAVARSERSDRPTPSQVVACVGLRAVHETALPNTLLSQSLFQRPPPLQN